MLENLTNSLLSAEFSERNIAILKQKIMEHQTMYTSLFKDTLKCKHHFLLHYPTVIENSGPVKHLWSMRFESKNKEYKNYTHSTSSRRNISFSVAKKAALKFSYFIIKKKSLNSDNNVIKKFTKINDDHKLFIEKYFNIKDISAMLYIEFNGTVYKENFYIFLNENVYKIISILHNNIFKDFFLFLFKKKCKKNDHYNCYFFEENDENEYDIISIQKVGKPFLIHTLPHGEKIFKIRHM